MARTAPQAPGKPVVGHFWSLRKDMLQTFERAAHYGDVVRMNFLVRRGYLLNHPDALRRVLVENHRNYSKGTRAYHLLRGPLGQGLLTAEGRNWRKHRRIAQPSFHPSQLEEFIPIMDSAALRMLERWKGKGGRLDTDAEMMRLTLEIVGRCLMSTDLSSSSETIGSAINLMLEDINTKITHLFALPMWVPTAKNRKLQAAYRDISRTVQNLIQARRQGTEQAPDLLQRFMDSVDPETGERMDDAQLEDEIKTMVSAGHETTANALTWACCLLADHPHVVRALQEEVDQAGDAPFTMERIGGLPYTEAVIKESMRLRPPVWIVGRLALEHDEIMGYDIPAGSYVFCPIYLVHRDPRFWDEPESFQPERFLAADGIAKQAYLPFSSGPRMCIGASFAVMEAKIILARVIQAACLERIAPDEVAMNPTITLRPRGGLVQGLKWRSGSLVSARGEGPAA